MLKRPQPNFLIVGAAKAGTSSLWHWLNQHPQVFMSANKEPAYFIRGYGIDDWDEYLALFADAGARPRIGEASAGYLAAPESAAWIRERLGPIDILIVLRNPVQRAYSLYCWMVMEGYEPLENFDAALDAEDERLASATFRRECLQYFDDYLYFHTGLYHDQVKRYLEIFGAEHVRILLFDDLVRDPAVFYANVSAFLGLERFDGAKPEAKNASLLPHSIARQHRLRALRTGAEKSLRRLAWPVSRVCDALMQRNLARGAKQPLPPTAKARLIAAYRGEIARLSALLGRDLSAWLKP